MVVPDEPQPTHAPWSCTNTLPFSILSKVMSPPSSFIEGLTFSITLWTAGCNSSSENGIINSP